VTDSLPAPRSKANAVGGPGVLPNHQNLIGFYILETLSLALRPTIADKGPQAIAKDREEYIRISGITLVRKSSCYRRGTFFVDCRNPGPAVSKHFVESVNSSLPASSTDCSGICAAGRTGSGCQRF